MLNNYEYFIVLAEEENISRAAEKLFISHQCLSKYLKNLEQAYRISFFERTPHLKLTPAGQAMLDTLRQVQFLEHNLDSQLDDIRSSRKGLIRLGTTEGRYRVLIPDLISEFKVLYPDVVLDVQYANTQQLTDRVLKNELDLVLLNQNTIDHNQLDSQTLLNERLYVVISDHMLERYFPDRYPQCKQDFALGTDLAEFQSIPFVMNRRQFNSRTILDSYLQARGIHLTCLMELTQLDIHFMMTARDYAASFCWSMYLPTIHQMNQSDSDRHLNVFPIRGLDTTNRFSLVTLKGKILPAYGRDLVALIKQKCATFAHANPADV